MWTDWYGGNPRETLYARSGGRSDLFRLGRLDQRSEPVYGRMKSFGVDDLERFPREWRGAIWASRGEVDLPREKVESLGSWLKGFLRPPYRQLVQVESPPSDFYWIEGQLLEIDFDEIPDEAYRAQLLYAFFFGITFSVQAARRNFALQCRERIGLPRALRALPIGIEDSISMLRLPFRAVRESEDGRRR